MNRLPARRVLTGLLAAALTAQALITGLPLIEMIISEFLHEEGPRADMWQQALGVVVLFALFGLPITLIATFAIGYPAWRMAELYGFETRKGGMLWGAICGGLIAALSTALTVLTADPGMSYGGSEGNLMVDGRLTALGWTAQLESLVFLVAVGACAGFVAVWVARRQ